MGSAVVKTVLSGGSPVCRKCSYLLHEKLKVVYDGKKIQKNPLPACSFILEFRVVKSQKLEQILVSLFVIWNWDILLSKHCFQNCTCISLISKLDFCCFHPILVTCFSVAFGNEVMKIIRNSVIIFHFVLLVLPCKLKT